MTAANATRLPAAVSCAAALPVTAVQEAPSADSSRATSRVGVVPEAAVQWTPSRTVVAWPAAAIGPLLAEAVRAAGARARSARTGRGAMAGSCLGGAAGPGGARPPDGQKVGVTRPVPLTLPVPLAYRPKV